MSNFDLIDDYLANKLQASERAAFESGIEADPALKSEVARQQLIIEGIKKARAAELKAMLNKVPVGGTVSLWGDWSVLKMAATIGVAGLLGTTLYFYMKDSNSILPSVPKAELKLDSLIPKENNTEIITTKETSKEKEKKSEITTPTTKKPKVKKQANAPKVDVVDPSSELLSGDGTEETNVSNKAAISMATIQVESKASTTYSFHYQFSDKKLLLYGPFDGFLYEILEVHGDNHALFLYFKDNFYHLDESKKDATELAPIRDRGLIQKLKEFRSKK